MAKHLIEVSNNGNVEATYEFDEGDETYNGVLKLIVLGGFEDDIFVLYRIEDGAKAVLETVKYNDQ